MGLLMKRDRETKGVGGEIKNPVYFFTKPLTTAKTPPYLMPPFMPLAEWQNDHEVYKRLEAVRKVFVTTWGANDFFLLLCVSRVFWIRYYFNRKVRKVFRKARKGFNAHQQVNMY